MNTQYPVSRGFASVIIIVVIVLLVAAGYGYLQALKSDSTIASPKPDVTTTSDVWYPVVYKTATTNYDTGFRASASGLYIPGSEMNDAATTTVLDDGKPIHFSNPAGLQQLGSLKMGDVYIVDAANVYKIKFKYIDADTPLSVSLHLVPGVDGKSLKALDGTPMYRDVSGLYCWEVGPGGGGGLDIANRFLSIPSSDLIEILTQNPVSGYKKSFNGYLIEDTTSKVNYKFTDGPSQCTNVATSTLESSVVSTSGDSWAISYAEYPR